MRSLIPPQRIVPLRGFGGSTRAEGYLFRPANAEELWKVFELARASGHQVSLRGAGKSYGDASYGTECLVVDFHRFNRILSWDNQAGVIEVEPGTTLEEVWHRTLPDGWWLPVVSGTSKATVGGALAMNIHGKNNLHAGTLGEHVTELDVLTPSGELHSLTPESPLFQSVIGGAGLLGVITRAKIKMKRVHSGNVRVFAASCSDWSDQFREFARYQDTTEYVVGWIDCFARGDHAGRGILHAATHVEALPGDASLSLKHQELPSRVLGFPKSQVWRVLKLLNNRAGMRRVNALKHAAGKMFENGKVRPQSLAKFNFLLDHVPDWERAYEPGGLIQCQYFVPREVAKSTFERLVEMQQQARLESFLAVMKRHRADSFLLSHAVDGYSLALDFKVTAKNRTALFDLAHRMNDVALRAGGRFYFAKDSTLTPEQAREYLGMALVALRTLREEHDPDGLLTTDLARRLQL